jgi:5'-methylthioadenosine phosphorylase
VELTAQIGIIGGTGLEKFEGMTTVAEVSRETPFGYPSDNIIIGELAGTQIAFLPRHGRNHHLTPSEIPVRANIFALKSLGVERIISVSAVGSLSEEIHPLDMVIPNQIIDRTRNRVGTFFGDGIVVHASFADPFCGQLSTLLEATARRLGVRTHAEGTYLAMEGPLFSTRAESQMYRSWGAKVIGMTALPEAKLAREAELCYATLACVTDYDCWHESEEDVTVELVAQNLQRNAGKARSILQMVIPKAALSQPCQCQCALENAILTSTESIEQPVKERLALLIGKYIQ